MTSSSSDAVGDNAHSFDMEPETPSPDGDVKDGDVAWDDNYSEILGFDFGDESGVDRSGLNAFVNSSFVAHRRMPVLDLILDRAARRMSTSLRQLTDENAEMELNDVTSIRFGDFVQGEPGPVVIGVVRSATLEGYSLVVADADFVFNVVDLLLGGRRGAPALSIEDRSFTAIELSLAQRLLDALIEDLEAAFTPVTVPAFQLERIETTPRFAAIVQEPSVCVLAKFRVRLGDNEAKASLVIPYSVLEPIKQQLVRDFVGETPGGDMAWKDQLEKEVDASIVSVKAVLAQKEMTLADLSSLALGQQLDFPAPPNMLAALQARSKNIAHGKVGRIGDRLAICIADTDETPVDNNSLTHNENEDAA